MSVTPVSSYSINSKNHPSSVFSQFGGREISCGYMYLPERDRVKKKKEKFTPEKVRALVGSIGGVALVLGTLMKKQKVKNPLHVDYKVSQMLTMAAAGNCGGILLSSIGEPAKDKKKKWKEGAFQMILTSAPLLFVDGGIKLCAKSKNKLVNNNFAKIIASIAGVYTGSHLAVWVSNKLRSEKEAKKPERELKPIDMIANFDDAVAILVLTRLPFTKYLHPERLLPFIYSFCGYRSGTGDTRNQS